MWAELEKVPLLGVDLEYTHGNVTLENCMLVGLI